jgi:prepilin-type N-terminal cleavage/methylation domain-containing protein
VTLVGAIAGRSRRPARRARGGRFRGPSGGRAAARGFTLIELIVTLFVLAVAAALVAPAMGRSVDAIRGRAEVSGMAAYLRAAREQSITSGVPLEVRLVPETRTLLVLVAGSDAVRSSRGFTALLAIEPEPPTATGVTFQPQGLSTGGIFRILAPGQRRYVVVVDALTGRVTYRPSES